MFRLITHIITYNCVDTPSMGLAGHQAVTTDVVDSQHPTVEDVDRAKIALNALARGIGSSSNSIGVNVRHVVLTLPNSATIKELV